MQKRWVTIAFVMLLALMGPKAHAAKILAAYVFPGPSHFMMINMLIKSLIERGHEVTMITALTLKPLNLGSNYTEILIEPSYNYWSDLKEIDSSANSLFDLADTSVTGFVKMLQLFGIRSAECALQQPKVQAIINAKDTKGKYDLFLSAQFAQSAFLALAHVYDIPVVTSCTLGTLNHMSQMTGIIQPWSFVPHGFAPYSDRMTFVQRLLNSFYSLYEDLAREFFYFPQMERLVEKYFANSSAKIPKVSEMEKNISILLLNSHAPIKSPRPTATNMIDVGGLHILPPKPLPNDMQRFLDEAEHGAIYFSFGTNVQSKDMPVETIQVFLNVFSKMKQRVLWKFEDERIKNLPSNVMMAKWMPQNDILAHPGVKVFITHGGLFGSQEGIYHAVPMLGIPFFADQLLNVNKAVIMGYAKKLDFKSITEELLYNALTDLIENPKYMDRVQKASAIFRDHPMSPIDTAIYWIEYVIRHKGAAHLRSAGLELNFFQFYLFDVIGFVLASVIIVVLAIVMIIRRFLYIRIKPIKKQKLKHK